MEVTTGAAANGPLPATDTARENAEPALPTGLGGRTDRTMGWPAPGGRLPTPPPRHPHRPRRALPEDRGHPARHRLDPRPHHPQCTPVGARPRGPDPTRPPPAPAHPPHPPTPPAPTPTPQH